MSPVDARAAHEQLERMLANPLFKHSKRYPALLRYVVEHALDGQTDPAHMKERTLGIEVFGRDPGYDTNLDPVVRTTAGEIRKRIAQYYHEPGHEFELRIELPSGTYVPEFHAPLGHTLVQSVAVTPTLTPAAPEVILLEHGRNAHASRTPWIIAAAACFVAIAAVSGALIATHALAPRSALDRFWAPVFDTPTTVLLCVGQPHFTGAPVMTAPTNAPETAVTLHNLYLMGKHYISLWDSMTLTRIAALMEAKSKPYRIRGELSTSLSDLRDGPSVLIGAFNNEWTIRLTGPLRYTFIHPADGKFGVMDRNNPSEPWMIDTALPYMQATEDYAVVTRIKDPTTDRYVVVAAGAAYWGTIAAGEFLTDPKYMEELAKGAPAGWDKKNIQIVIGTKVISGNSGPPRVLAAYFW